MLNRESIIGAKFGRLTVLRFSHKKNRRLCYFCRCECGAEVVMPSNDFRYGNTKSCGCLRRDTTTANKTTHGQYYTKTYKSWQGMIHRCKSPNAWRQKYYGSRGITVCDRWLKSFENFYADMGNCPPNMSLDRINNDLGYSKENCKWSTRTEQNRNTRQNRLITFNGKTMCLAAWAEQIGIRSNVLYKRIQRHGEQAAVAMPAKIK